MSAPISDAIPFDAPGDDDEYLTEKDRPEEDVMTPKERAVGIFLNMGLACDLRVGSATVSDEFVERIASAIAVAERAVASECAGIVRTWPWELGDTAGERNEQVSAEIERRFGVKP